MIKISLAFLAVALVCTSCLSTLEGEPVGFAPDADPDCEEYWDALVALDVEAAKTVIERFDPDGPRDLFEVVDEFQEVAEPIEPASVEDLRIRFDRETQELLAELDAAEDVDALLAGSLPLIERWSADLDEYSTEIRREVDKRCPAAEPN